ncbi:MAG: hypothetical protein ACPGOV_15430 [Magnetovibrionaceae bacterium]
MIKIPTAKGLLAIAAVLTLGACETFEQMTGQAPPPPPCPAISFLADASEITRFLPGPGRDLTDVVFTAEMARYAGGCGYDVDDETGRGTLTIEMQVTFAVRRGPAEKQGQVALPYFVTVTDQDRNILNKAVMEGSVGFPGNRTTVQFIDAPVVLDLPIRDGIVGTDYKVFLGFQLTRDELDFNRQQNPG